MASKQSKVVTTVRFLVEIGGRATGGFSEVSGLQAEVEYEEYQEGGVNNYTHRFPTRTKYSPLVLKRGLFDSFELWQWHQGMTSGKPVTKDGAIILHDVTSGKEICRWNFYGAFPVKWSGPSLNATRAEVAIETLELAYRELEFCKGPA